MTNTTLLRNCIERSGYKLQFLADKIGISRFTLLNKIENHTEFKLSEVTKLQELLSLSNDEREEIFFGN